MSDTLTTYLGLTKPAVGSSRDTWGAKVNADLDLIDQFVGTGLPIGCIIDFAGPTAPPGWLICDGRLISRVTYAALFAVIGTYWGAGDGSTTFALPNPNGRAGIGPGTVIDQNGVSTTFGYTGLYGDLAMPILQANLPNYNLGTDVQGYHSHGGATAPGGNHTHSIDVQGTHSHGGATATENQNHTHTGVTDAQGNHLHNVSAWGAAGGPAAVAPGGIATGNTIQTDVQGLHAHNFTTSTESVPHIHGISVDGAHTHNLGYSGNLQLGIYGDGNHQHNVWLNGGGNWLNILQPVICVTKIIYAGQAAVTSVVAASAPAPLRLEAPDELAAIREELAQLRAFLAPPRSQRLLRAPLRGSH